METHTSVALEHRSQRVLTNTSKSRNITKHSSTEEGARSRSNYRINNGISSNNTRLLPQSKLKCGTSSFKETLGSPSNAKVNFKSSAGSTSQTASGGRFQATSSLKENNSSELDTECYFIEKQTSGSYKSFQDNGTDYNNTESIHDTTQSLNIDYVNTEDNCGTSACGNRSTDVSLDRDAWSEKMPADSSSGYNLHQRTCSPDGSINKRVSF